MPNYKKMYFGLAGKIADAIELLQGALSEGEDAYCDEEDTAENEDE